MDLQSHAREKKAGCLSSTHNTKANLFPSNLSRSRWRVFPPTRLEVKLLGILRIPETNTEQSALQVRRSVLPSNSSRLCKKVASLAENGRRDTAPSSANRKQQAVHARDFPQPHTLQDIQHFPAGMSRIRVRRHQKTSSSALRKELLSLKRKSHSRFSETLDSHQHEGASTVRAENCAMQDADKRGLNDRAKTRRPASQI